MFGSLPLSAALPAADFDRALGWYSEKLGLEPEERNDDGQTAWFATGGHRFVLYASQFAGTNQATAAGFVVEDFDSAVASLRNSGVVLEDYDFGELKTEDGVFTTPDGDKIAQVSTGWRWLPAERIAMLESVVRLEQQHGTSDRPAAVKPYQGLASTSGCAEHGRPIGRLVKKGFHHAYVGIANASRRIGSGRTVTGRVLCRTASPTLHARQLRAG